MAVLTAAAPAVLAGHAGHASPAPSSPWLVSRRWDLLAFGSPAVFAFALLAWGAATGLLAEATPAWTWVLTVVAVDVAHVWATAYRVYADPDELRRRPALYFGVPLAVYAAGVLLYSGSPALFWRALAYVAVFHFVRQQYGWVALCRRRLGTSSAWDRRLDDAAVYSSTLYPILYWHANLPREFEWFVAGDFIPGLPAGVARALLPLHLAIMAAYALRQLWLVARGRPVSHGKNLVVATTWLAWFGGIVLLDSDYAFTVTNVLVHGIPYLALVWLYGRSRYAGAAGPVARLFRARGALLFLAPLLALAWLEEWGWDRLLWHERPALFPGAGLSPGPEALALLVPLLALPQATHYVLDAWIWRARDNPDLARHLGLARSSG